MIAGGILVRLLHISIHLFHKQNVFLIDYFNERLNETKRSGYAGCSFLGSQDQTVSKCFSIKRERRCFCCAREKYFSLMAEKGDSMKHAEN